MADLTVSKFEHDGLESFCSDDWAGVGLSYEMAYDLSSFFCCPRDFFQFLVDSFPANSFVFDLALTNVLAKEVQFSSFWGNAVELIIINSVDDQEEFRELFDIDRSNKILKNELALLGQKIQIAKEKEAIQNARCAIRAPKEKKEFLFESKLEAFLQVNDIHVERQVSSNQKRIDLWIPGQLMIECKAGKVTGDDICQAVDYLATFERDVLLVGTGMTTAASRGIEAINKLSSECKLLFVTQEACFGYLKAVCK